MDLSPAQRAPLRFTFRYLDGGWQGRDFQVEMAVR